MEPIFWKRQLLAISLVRFFISHLDLQSALYWKSEQVIDQGQKFSQLPFLAAKLHLDY